MPPVFDPYCRPIAFQVWEHSWPPWAKHTPLRARKCPIYGLALGPPMAKARLIWKPVWAHMTFHRFTQGVALLPCCNVHKHEKAPYQANFKKRIC